MANWYIPPIIFFLGWIASRIADEIPLPKKWKHKINMFFTHIIKYIKNKPSEVTYCFKTQSVEYEKERFDKIHELIKNKDFIPAGNIGNFLKFTKVIGLINPDIVFKPTLLPNGEELYLESIEFEIIIDIKYNNFILEIQDLFRIKEALQICLLEDYGEFIGESLTCKLSNMYRFSGFLSEYDISTLTGYLHGVQIIFNSNEMIVMGNFNSDLLSILKKAITCYY